MFHYNYELQGQEKNVWSSCESLSLNLLKWLYLLNNNYNGVINDLYFENDNEYELCN
jgi:hypothetical protein